MKSVEPCARCGERPATSGPLCPACAELGPLSPEEGDRWRSRRAEGCDHDWHGAPNDSVVCSKCGSVEYV